MSFHFFIFYISIYIYYLNVFNSTHTLSSVMPACSSDLLLLGLRFGDGSSQDTLSVAWFGLDMPRQILWTSAPATSPRHIAWHEIIIMRYITLFHLVSSCFPKIKSDQQWSARSAKRSLRLLSDMKPPWQRKNAVCVSMFAFHAGVAMYHNVSVSVSFHEFSIGLPSIYGSTSCNNSYCSRKIRKNAFD
jgi:hypothetical protein